MKRTSIIFVGLVAVVSVLWFGVVNAANVRHGDSPTIMANEIVDGTLYSAGNTIKIDGTVQGDLMCAGQTLTITGTIEGDVICAAQEVTISGHVMGSVRIAAQKATLTGKIDGSATVAGMDVTFGKDAVVAHDVTLLGQRATLGGMIARDATVIANNFSATAKIGRDLDVTGEHVVLDDKTDVAGDFRYASPEKAQLVGDARVAGSTDYRVTDHNTASGPVTPAMYLTSVFFTFVSFLLVGLALLTGAPRALGAVVAQLRQSPFGALGAGLLGLVVPPFVAAMLIVTIVGAPLGVIMLLGWIIMLMTGVVFTAQRLGEVILAKLNVQESWQQFAGLMAGLFALFVVSLVPYVGVMIMFSAVVWGVGGIWYALVKNRTKALVKAKPGAEKS